MLSGAEKFLCFEVRRCVVKQGDIESGDAYRLCWHLRLACLEIVKAIVYCAENFGLAFGEPEKVQP